MTLCPVQLLGVKSVNQSLYYKWPLFRSFVQITSWFVATWYVQYVVSVVKETEGPRDSDEEMKDTNVDDADDNHPGQEYTHLPL